MGERVEGNGARLGGRISGAIGGGSLNDAEAGEFQSFLDAHHAERGEPCRSGELLLRGSATQGIALARADLVPEVTITADRRVIGIRSEPRTLTCWSAAEIFPLAESFAAVRRAFDRESEHQRRLATIFNCA